MKTSRRKIQATVNSKVNRSCPPSFHARVTGKMKAVYNISSAIMSKCHALARMDQGAIKGRKKIEYLCVINIIMKLEGDAGSRQAMQSRRLTPVCDRMMLSLLVFG